MSSFHTRSKDLYPAKLLMNFTPAFVSVLIAVNSVTN